MEFRADDCVSCGVADMVAEALIGGLAGFGFGDGNRELFVNYKLARKE